MLRNKSNTYSAFLALIYGDIFNYPLKEEEIEKFLIKNPKSEIQNPKQIQNPNDKNSKQEHFEPSNFIFKRHGYYCLKGREGIIEKRIEREQISKRKLQLTKKIVTILKYIPTIQLIGVSGSLAMLNADEDDDIDLFIIAKNKTLWITRLFVLFILQVFGVRRARNAKKTQDVVCTNMFIDETSLLLPKHMQNLYTAHEVIQMKPLFVREDMERKFLEANHWVQEYLPNAFAKGEGLRVKGEERVPFTLLESLARFLQLWYMKKHRTTEIITDTLLAFHPDDQSRYVLKEFKKRIKKYARYI